MDALLVTLLTGLVGSMGDRVQLVALALALHYRRDGVVLLGVAVAVVANAAISAVGGALIAPMLTGEARLLLLALSFLFAGLGMMKAAKPYTLSPSTRFSPLLVSIGTIFVIGLGDQTQFVIAAMAARTADPLFSGIGGAVGIWAACAIAVAVGRNWPELLPLPLVRRIAGGVGLAVAAILALKALRLI